MAGYLDMSQFLGTRKKACFPIKMLDGEELLARKLSAQEQAEIYEADKKGGGNPAVRVMLHVLFILCDPGDPENKRMFDPNNSQHLALIGKMDSDELAEIVRQYYEHVGAPKNKEELQELAKKSEATELEDISSSSVSILDASIPIS